MSTSTPTDREPCRLCGRQPEIVVGHSWTCNHGEGSYASLIFGPTKDLNGTGWDQHMRDWDAAYAAREKKGG